MTEKNLHESPKLDNQEAESCRYSAIIKISLNSTLCLKNILKLSKVSIISLNSLKNIFTISFRLNILFLKYFPKFKKIKKNTPKLF